MFVCFFLFVIRVSFLHIFVSPTGCSIELSGDNDNGATNLQACTGECDSDDRNAILIQITLIIHIMYWACAMVFLSITECASGLYCFQRENGEEIPGCTGDHRHGFVSAIKHFVPTEMCLIS